MEPDAVKPIIDMYKKVFKNDDFAKKQGLTPAKRLEFHKKESLPILEEIKKYANDKVKDGTFEENSNFGKAVTYLNNHWKGLTAFCRIEGTEVENNMAERALKLIVTGRKNFYFYRTEESAAISDVVTSILATCKINDVNPFEYAVAILRHQKEIKIAPEKWLPWNFKENFA